MPRPVGQRGHGSGNIAANGLDAPGADVWSAIAQDRAHRSTSRRMGGARVGEFGVQPWFEGGRSVIVNDGQGGEDLDDAVEVGAAAHDDVREAADPDQIAFLVVGEQHYQYPLHSPACDRGPATGFRVGVGQVQYPGQPGVVRRGAVPQIDCGVAVAAHFGVEQRRLDPSSDRPGGRRWWWFERPALGSVGSRRSPGPGRPPVHVGEEQLVVPEVAQVRRAGRGCSAPDGSGADGRRRAGKDGQAVTAPCWREPLSGHVAPVRRQQAPPGYLFDRPQPGPLGRPARYDFLPLSYG
ncbi:hypothetical protein GA0070615_6505 [Micromonospora aurantiaca]|nr:hypothetical protein GA0070615_6505 [Micromonospora aurantiaca]